MCLDLSIQSTPLLKKSSFPNITFDVIFMSSISGNNNLAQSYYNNMIQTYPPPLPTFQNWYSNLHKTTSQLLSIAKDSSNNILASILGYSMSSTFCLNLWNSNPTIPKLGQMVLIEMIDYIRNKLPNIVAIKAIDVSNKTAWITLDNYGFK